MNMNMQINRKIMPFFDFYSLSYHPMKLFMTVTDHSRNHVNSIDRWGSSL